jgi:two-component system CheB/CheR fusion protein
MARKDRSSASALQDPPAADTARAEALSQPEGGFPVVGIGASAGGLEATRRLLDVLSPNSGSAFILVQHLDPTHQSLMVELLGRHSRMPVLQAESGKQVEPNHVYVIPPGTYLSVARGTLMVSEPQARHGARLPFDFLLRSMAVEYGPRAVAIVLSGTGADGSIGARAIKQAGGFVIAQEPAEAAYDGMPRSAITAGCVDRVLAILDIPATLAAVARGDAHPLIGADPSFEASNTLRAILELLRDRTGHDFLLYKPGTMERRIERRMAIAGIDLTDMERYLALLRETDVERDLLAKDLLIHVTSFFRDAKVFDELAEKTIPALLQAVPAGQPLRIWVPGCSTGEEVYSLAMLFREQIALLGREMKLQIFASDIDPEAVVAAREGLYPHSIEAVVTPARLARFFAKEDLGYRVLPELRSLVVFAAQDVLADPPFSRLDFISCRNLMIYLGAEAQSKVISLFNFALRDGGILLLGSSETAGNLDGRFEVLSKTDRIYRRTGRVRPGELGFVLGSAISRLPVRAGPLQPLSRQTALAEMCRRLVMEAYAPAAVLVNRKLECLYSIGPADRYLQVPTGYPTLDVLAMARSELRTKLRSAIQRATEGNARVVLGGGRTTADGETVAFDIDVRPVVGDGEAMLLICFVDKPKSDRASRRPLSPTDAPRIAELEHELAATRLELQGAIHNLEISNEDQKAINEEALSVQEEYQSTNEELLTSKEELQSLNEELTALNSQLQETLERQRTTSNDLQNVLYSTDVATLFLDSQLNIRFFTPATKALFSVIPGDVGRPLADLSSLSADGTLLADARRVLTSLEPREREIEARRGTFYVRRITPYRTQESGVEGVVITFVDITERRHIADALEAAKRRAETASTAKSRFLAAASHDLRQPLQTLTLLQGLLEISVDGERTTKLVSRLGETLASMSSMLNTLLDINQIDSGTVHADPTDFPIGDLLERLRDEFAYQAESQGLRLRVVHCGLTIHSDPSLLEQILRNLISNALKYTVQGTVLLGCRRHAETVSIEVCDTGIGIADQEFQAIFEEYHQIDNAARERARGLGLGLSIVQRLGNLLGHRISVRSQVGRGSIFAVEVPRVISAEEGARPMSQVRAAPPDVRAGSILVVEDDPEMRELLALVLNDQGHRVTEASDGNSAIDMVARGSVRPDLILADYNLPQAMTGLQCAVRLRQLLRRETPVIILSGDISTGTLRDVTQQGCEQLSKPVKLKDLIAAIQRLLPATRATREPAPPPAATETAGPTIFVVDDESHVRQGMRAVLEQAGRVVEDFGSCEAFLAAYRPGRAACLLVDAYLPGMDGFQLLQRLRGDGHVLPSIMITGNGDVRMAVRAMKAGASDFIEKPITRENLLACVDRALEQGSDATKLADWHKDAVDRLAGLTTRQRQIMAMVLAGKANKTIAADLGISRRTVENHRAQIMKKTGSKSLPALARLALTAEES